MKSTNKSTPLENSLDEQTMNWHNDALRPAHDAKEMSPHLQPTDRLSTDDKSTKRLSSKTHANYKNSVPKTKNYATNNHFHVLSPTLLLNKKDKMLFVLLQFNNYENQGLLDTRAMQSALSEAELRKITAVHPEAVLDELPPPNFKVQIANGNLVPIRKQVLLRFFIAGKVFEEVFLVLPTMGTTLIGTSFSEKYSVNLDIKNHLVHFPNHMMSMQVRQQTNKKFKTGLIKLYSSSRTTIPPHHQVLIEVHSDADISRTTGTVEGTPAFTDHPDDAAAVINQLFVNPEMKSTKWYPTPETCSEPDKLNKIERRIFDEILALRELEKLDPTRSHEERIKFLQNF